MTAEAELGRLTARPRQGMAATTVDTGVQPLGLGGERDGLIHIPAGYRTDTPAPLLLLLHGATGYGGRMLKRVPDLADATGVIVLAPDSRDGSWDIISRGGYGPDVAFLDRALAATFDRYAIDPARVAIGGFSDGASYALSLGVMNGDLFTHIIALSPGFMAPLDQTGKPRIFVSHGTMDEVLPIDMCSRPLVMMLYQGGYDLNYQEFDGPHAMPAPIVEQAMDWFLDRA